MGRKIIYSMRVSPNFFCRVANLWVPSILHINTTLPPIFINITIANGVALEIISPTIGLSPSFVVYLGGNLRLSAENLVSP